MILEEASNPLRDFSVQIFSLVKKLTGAEPKYMDYKWYRAPPTGPVCLYIYITGRRGKGNHANSVHLAALWNQKFATFEGIEKGNNWFGSQSADFYARPDDPHAKARAEEFIRLAYFAVAVKKFSEVEQGRDAQSAFAEQVIEITANTAKAPSAARWLNRMLSGIGKQAVVGVREVLVNIASDVVKKILLGS